ncbi:hypothetical protein OAO62_04790 [Gammaproteobacteria bacterium]|nr:hypothetical protein [Gammaproteobacteria bacterium]
MKHLLLSLALIISANAWADKIAFSCERIKDSPFDTEIILDISIDTKKKTVSSGSKNHKYEEKGDEIIFRVGFGRFVMNRMTGTMQAQEGQGLLWKTNGTFKCKKAERLF